jgi:ADP-heptose:LPS heptosyltransferase
VLDLPRSLGERDVAPGQMPVAAAIPPVAAAIPRTLQPIVIRFGRLGDMVQLSAALRLLHQRFSSPCIVLGAGPWNSRVYMGHPDVARIRTFTRHFPFVLSWTWWRVLRELRRSDPSPIYVFERQSRQLARIRRMLALSGVNPARCLFISDTPFSADEHLLDSFERFAQRTPEAINAADFPTPATAAKPAPRLRVLDSERYELAGWLKNRQLSGRELVLIQPGNFRTMSRRRDHWRQANADDKAWPLENWVRLIEKVLTTLPKASVVLCGAPQEAPMLRQIQLTATSPRVAIGDLPLRQLMALCESAHSMISIDTGPAHAAAAFGLPLVVMFGAESPAHWLPRSPSGSAVIGVGGRPESTRVDQISVDKVFAAWKELLATLTAPARSSANPTLSCGSA